MKLLWVALAALVLSGCAVVPAPYPYGVGPEVSVGVGVGVPVGVPVHRHGYSRGSYRPYYGRGYHGHYGPPRHRRW
jgi:hypothetical protein